MKNSTNIPARPNLGGLLPALAATLLAGHVATATPYATCLTNNAGTISFRLNEAADNVKVVTNGVPIDLGARAAGVTTTNLAITGAYQVVVKKSTVVGWTQISSDANTYSKYFAPRGLALNQNPASPYFGRVYIANAAAGSSGSPARAVGIGIYMVNADLTDAVGNLNTAATGSISFGTAGSSPYKIGVGGDDSLYINNYDAVIATTWRTDPNVTAGSAQIVLTGIGETASPTVHGRAFNSPIVRGSLAGNNLTLYNFEGNRAGALNTISRWDINSGPLPWGSGPVTLGWADHSPANLAVANLLTDLALGPDGKFYTSIYRAVDDTAVLKVFDTNGTTVLWDSRSAAGVAGNSTLWLTRALAVSPLGNSLATIFDDNHVIVFKLTNGIPDWGTLKSLGTTGTTFGRDVAFDAAGNIYTVGSGITLLRVFSPGGATVATTSSTGTFALSDLSTNVNVVATSAAASEAGPVNGVFTITRTGDTSGPLTVNFGMSGTATFGVDYILSATNSVTIGAGQSSTNVIAQVIDDAIAEAPESVVMTLSNNAALYSLVNPPTSATVVIADNETPDISVTGLYTNMYERVANDFVQFQLTRRGLTNDAVAVSLSYAGTALNGADFSDPLGGIVTIAAGAQTATFKLNPIDNALLDGNRSIIVGIAPAGAGEYAVNAINNAAPGLIIDDELGAVDPGDVLFTENFDTPYAANSLPATWSFLAAANNNVSDYNFTYGYDYSANGIPAPPNTGTTLGLKVTVNKGDAAASAAGINFYPVGQVFSNNFAVRFNMLLAINSSTGQTEYATFGINHSGTKTNWWRSSSGGVGNARALTTDGLFYEINSSGADATDYSLMTQGTGSATNPPIIASRVYTSMGQTFKIPPYGVTGEPGIAQNNSGVLTTPTWVDVEISQITNMLTLRMNNTIVLQTTNSSVFTNGNVMLGYCDPYDSIGGVGGAVYYDNLSVVRIHPLSIVTQPVSNVVIPAGNSTNLTVVTSGSATGVTNYQWSFNGVAMPDATNATLVLNNSLPTNDGVYSVVISDGVSTLTSIPTTFLVLTPGAVVGTGTGLEGGYWTAHTNNAPYTGSPTLTRLDSTVNFDWVAGSPDPAIAADYFTARWLGQIQALGTETYTFTTLSDDGARLWVNGQLIIDSWVLQAATPRSGTIALTGNNKYDIVLEYFEQTGNAVAKLYWSNATTVGYSPVPQSQLYPAASVLPAIALTSPANGANYTAPATISLTASVTTNHNAIQYVAFYNGASLIANVTNSPYQYSWSSVPASSYNLSAAVVYNSSWTVTSATNSVTVLALNAPTISGISGNSLNYSGGIGSQFVLLGTNVITAPLTNWTRLATNTAPSGSFTIPVGSGASAFYSIKSE